MSFCAQHLRDSQREAFDALTRAIDSATTIAICAHTSPDGDALGSELALARLIRVHWGSEKQVVCLLADEHDPPALYRFLPGFAELKRPSSYTQNPDLFLCVDLCVATRLAAARKVMERARQVFIVDHHPCEEPFASGCIRADAAACGVIVSEYALEIGEPITKDVATLLFVALVTDTGRFQYQNADPEAFGVASLLVDAGANPSEVSLHVYQSYSLSYLHLEAAVMGRIRLVCGGRVALSWVRWDDFEKSGAKEDEADGLVDAVRQVRGVDVALLLRQTPKGNFRGNLRSKGPLDVSYVAKALGGGGHAAAAGFTLEASDLEEALRIVTPLLDELMEIQTEGAH